MAEVKDLASVCGEKNPTGIKVKLHAVCKDDILTWPAKKVTTGTGDSITFDGDIVLKAGKKFATIDVIADTGEVTHTAVGTRGSKSMVNKLDFKVVKSIASDEWFNDNLNSCLVVLVTEKTGKVRVLGSPDVPAELLAAEGKTGMTLESEKSWIASINDSTGEVAPYYEGAIDLTV
jgi:hypothetical protein